MAITNTEGMLPSEKAKLYKKMYGTMKVAGKVQLDEAAGKAQREAAKLAEKSYGGHTPAKKKHQLLSAHLMQSLQSHTFRKLVSNRSLLRWLGTLANAPRAYSRHSAYRRSLRRTVPTHLR